MNRTVHPGVLYGECWPSGAFAVSGPSLRFVRVSRGGQTAGQDDAGRIVSLDGRVLLGTSCGVSPVIWRGEELVSNEGCRHGTQGFRYVRPDGSIATGDETYKHPTLPLWEYTDLGDGLLIGQGEAGAVVWDGQAMRMLEPGHCTFIRANREGDQVGIAIAKQQDGPTCVLIHASVGELRALPPLASPPVPPEPLPMTNVPDVSAFVASFLGSSLIQFPGDQEKTRAHTFELVNALCLELRERDQNWGLLLKRGGPRDRSADVLLYRTSPTQAQVVDVVADAEGADGVPRPYWEPKDIRAIEEWLEPFGIVNQPPVETPPIVNPPANPLLLDAGPLLRPILLQLDAAQRDVRALTARLLALENRPVVSAPAVPSRVALKTAHGRYVAAELDGRLVADREDRGEWEVFDLVPVP